MQFRLQDSSSIRFPVDGKPITFNTVYEWLEADGTWKPRFTVGHVNSGEDAAAAVVD